MEVLVVNRSKHELPEYQTENSAGMDLRANIDHTITIPPGGRVMVPTGIYIKLPQGTEAQIRSRSGLAWKDGVAVINSPGTIDADYVGEVKVLLYNTTLFAFDIEDGDRVAQMVVAKYERVQWKKTDSLEDTGRGSGGFGSTGTK
jgi:dUTP pyrophosphatase